MPTFFADAWFFIALIDRRDSHHRTAQRLSVELARNPVVTHDAVLTEVLTYFADEGSNMRDAAVRAVRHALRAYDVVVSDRELFLVALDRYAARPDKEYSLTDCMSMVVMEAREIRHVLTNDHHFTHAGFLIVNG